jgi:hypothetical protein
VFSPYTLLPWFSIHDLVPHPHTLEPTAANATSPAEQTTTPINSTTPPPPSSDAPAAPLCQDPADLPALENIPATNVSSPNPNANPLETFHKIPNEQELRRAAHKRKCDQKNAGRKKAKLAKLEIAIDERADFKQIPQFDTSSTPHCSTAYLGLSTLPSPPPALRGSPKERLDELRDAGYMMFLRDIE